MMDKRITIELIAFLLALVVSLSSGLNENNAHSERHDKNDGLREYCLIEENFEARCLRNELIVVTQASYGRMRIGRCLEAEGNLLLTTLGSDPLFIGCSVDVLYLLNRKCAGKNYCEIRGATDVDLKKEKPCHAGLPKYLEVDYECVTVIEEDRSCSVSVTSNPLHIMRSSSSSSKPSCGTKSQPWRLEAPVGQQINVSLLNFGSRTSDTSNRESHCHKYGYIVDKSAKKNISLCDLVVHASQRLTVYRSMANIIEIVSSLTTSQQQENNNSDVSSFLLRFVAVGCSDLVPPDDSWLRRNDNEAVVGCYSSRQTWYIRCTGNNWVGVIGNCTRAKHTYHTVSNTASSQTACETDLVASQVSVVIQSRTAGYDHQVLVIAAVAFLALVICVSIICCAAVCIKRYYANVARVYMNKIEESEHGKKTEQMIVLCHNNQNEGL